MGSDSGSDIAFLPYSSSDSNVELDKDQFLSTPNKRKKKSQQIHPSKQFKMFSTNGICTVIEKRIHIVPKQIVSKGVFMPL